MSTAVQKVAEINNPSKKKKEEKSGLDLAHRDQPEFSGCSSNEKSIYEKKYKEIISIDSESGGIIVLE